MAKQIYNTATKKNEDNPLDLLNRPSQFKDEEQLVKEFEFMRDNNVLDIPNPTDADFNPDKGVDHDYVFGLHEGGGDFSVQSAELQSNWGKFFKSVGRGVSKGLVGAGLGTGALLTSAINRDAAERITAYADELKSDIDRGMPVHELGVDETSSLTDNIFRFSTLESIVASATEFGITGAGVSMGVNMAGRGLLALGGTIEGVIGAGRIANGVGTAGKLAGGTGTGVDIGLWGIKSDAVITGFGTNIVEGKSMANEVERELNDFYNTVLYNPSVSDEVKAKIREDIRGAGNDVMALNTMMTLSSIVQMSRLGKLANLGKNSRPGKWSVLKDILGVVGPIDGVEEIGQAVFQKSAGDDAKMKVDEDYAAIENKGLEFKGDRADLAYDPKKAGSSLTYSLDPEEYDRVYKDNALTTLGYISKHATTKAAMTEGFAGIVGGGPKFMITGIPNLKKNLERSQEAYDKKESMRSEVVTLMRSLSSDNLNNEVYLAKIMEDLSALTGADETFSGLEQATSDYAIETMAIDAALNDQHTNIIAFVKEQKKQIEQNLSAGTITQEDAAAATARMTLLAERSFANRNINSYGNPNTEAHNRRERALYDAADKIIDGMPNTMNTQAGIQNSPIPTETDNETGNDTFNIFNIVDRSEQSGDDAVATITGLVKNLKYKPALGPAGSFDRFFSRFKTGLLKEDLAYAFNLSSSEDRYLAEDRYEVLKSHVDFEGITNTEQLQQAVGEALGYDLGLGTADNGTEHVADTDASSEARTSKANKKSKTKSRKNTTKKSAPSKALTRLDFTLGDVSFSGTKMQMKRQLEVARAANKKEQTRIRSAKFQAEAVKERNISTKIGKLLSKANSTNRQSKVTSVINSLHNIIASTDGTLRLQALSALATVEKRAQESAATKASGQTASTKKSKKSARETVDSVNDDDKADPDLDLGTPDGAVVEEVPPTMEEAKKIKAEEDAADSQSTTEALVSEAVKAEEESSQNVESEGTNAGPIQTGEDLEDTDPRTLMERVSGELKGLRDSGKQEVTKTDTSAVRKELARIKRKIGNIIENMTAIAGEDVEISYETIYAILKELKVPNLDTAEGQNLVKVVIAEFNGEAITDFQAPVVGQKKYKKKKSADEPFLIGPHDIPAGDLTIKSLSMSGLAIAWEEGSKLIRDFTRIKKGTTLKFVVVPENNISTPVFVDEGAPISWREFKEGLVDVSKKQDGSIMGYEGNPMFTVENMRPIQVIAEGEVVGHMHTVQWIDKRQHADAETRARAIRDLQNGRNTIYKNSKNGQVATGKVKSRKENIRPNDNDTGTDGTALSVERSFDNRTSTGQILSGDKNVSFAIIGDNGELMGISDELRSKLYVHEELAEMSGATVAIVPLENSGRYQIVKLNTSRLTKQEFESIVFMLTSDLVAATNRDNAYKIGRLNMHGGRNGKPTKGTPKPNVLVNLLQAFTNVNFTPSTLDGDYTSLRISAKVDAQDKNVLVVGLTISGTEYVIRYRYGNPVSHNSEQFKGYALDTEMGPAGTPVPIIVKRAIASGNELPSSMGEITSMLKQVLTDPNAYPFANVDLIQLEYAQQRGEQSDEIPHVHTDAKGRSIIARKSGNYVTEVIGKRTETHVKPPMNTSGGKTYVTNTIIQVEVDEQPVVKQANKEVKATKGKTVKKIQRIITTEIHDKEVAKMKAYVEDARELVEGLKDTPDEVVIPEDSIPELIQMITDANLHLVVSDVALDMLVMGPDVTAKQYKQAFAVILSDTRKASAKAVRARTKFINTNSLKERVIPTGKDAIFDSPIPESTLSEADKILKHTYATLIEKFKIGKTYEPQEVLDVIAEVTGVSEESQAALDIIKDFINTSGVKINFTDRDVKVGGTYDTSTNEVDININSIIKSKLLTSPLTVGEYIIHELVHAGTAHIIHSAKVGNELSKEAIYAVAELQVFFDLIKLDRDFDGIYGAENMYEMLSELANPKFVALLKSKKVTVEEVATTWYDKILGHVAALFGITRKIYVSTDVYNKAIQALEKIVTANTKERVEAYLEDRNRTDVVPKISTADAMALRFGGEVTPAIQRRTDIRAMFDKKDRELKYGPLADEIFNREILQERTNKFGSFFSKVNKTAPKAEPEIARESTEMSTDEVASTTTEPAVKKPSKRTPEVPKKRAPITNALPKEDPLAGLLGKDGIADMKEQIAYEVMHPFKLEVAAVIKDTAAGTDKKAKYFGYTKPQLLTLILKDLKKVDTVLAKFRETGKAISGRERMLVRSTLQRSLLLKDIKPESVASLLDMKVVNDDRRLLVDHISAYAINEYHAGKNSPVQVKKGPEVITQEEKKALAFKKRSTTETTKKDVLPQAIVKRALEAYKYKKTRVKFNGTEKAAVRLSIAGQVNELFTQRNQEVLNREDSQRMIKDVRQLFNENLQELIDGLGNYLVEETKDIVEKPLSKEEKREVAKIEQYIEVLTGLQTDEKLFQEGIDTGFNMLDIVKKSGDIGEGEEVQSNETPEQQAYQNANYHITKNPTAGATERTRAKLELVQSYEVRTIEGVEVVTPKVSLLGTPVYEDQVFLKLLSIFTIARNTTTFQNKVDVLEDLASAVRLNPIRNVGLYFVVDLLEQLTLNGHSNAFTATDKARFNSVLTKDAANLNGIKMAKDGGRLTKYNASYNSTVENMIRKVDGMIKNMVGDKSGIEYQSVYDVINKTTGTVPKIGTRTKSIMAALNKFSTDEQLYYDLTPENLAEVSLLSLSGISNAFTRSEKLIRKEINASSNPSRLFEAYNSIHKSINDALTIKTIKLLQGFGVTTDPGFGEELIATLNSRENITNINTLNTSNTPSPLISTLFKGLKNLQKIGFNADGTITGKLNLPFKSFLNWVADKSIASFLSAVSRVGQAMTANFIDPSFMNAIYKDLKTPENLAQLKKDIFARDSRVLSLIEKYKGSKKMAWIDSLYELPERQGLVGSWTSTVDKEDSPTQHMMYTLGAYLISIGYGHREEKKTTSGEKYDFVVDSMGDKDYVLKVRKGSFPLMTFSDSGATFVGSSFDFEAATIGEEGQLEVSEDNYQYMAEATVLPELNRFLALEYNAGAVNIDAYNGKLIYSLPELNRDGRIQSLLRASGLERIESIASLKAEHTALYDMIMAEVATELHTATDRYINLMKANGVLIKTRDHWALGGAVKNAEEFKNLLYSEEEMIALTGEVGEAYTEQTDEEKKEFRGMVNSAFNELSTTLEEFNMGSILDTKDLDEVDSSIVYNSLMNLVYTVLDEESDVVEETLNVDQTNHKEAIAETVKLLGGVGINVDNIKKKETYNKIDISKVLGTDLHKSINEFVVSSYKDLTQKVQQKTPGISLSNVNMDRLAQVIFNREYSAQFHNANNQQLLFGDPAGSYKQAGMNRDKLMEDVGYDMVADAVRTYDNKSKRDKRFVSPSVVSNFDNQEFIYLAIEDVVEDSQVYDANRIDVADAATFATTKAKAILLQNEGKLEKRDINALTSYYNAKIDLQTLKDRLGKEDISELHIVVDKPKATLVLNETLDDGSIITYHLFVKTGESLLTQRLAGSDEEFVGNKLIGLMEQLEEDSVLNPKKLPVIATSPTSSKIGAPTASNRINVNDIVIEKREDGTNRYMIADPAGNMNLSAKNFTVGKVRDRGRQLSTKHKESKKSKAGGQLTDLQMNNIPFGSPRVQLFGTNGDFRKVRIREYYEKIQDALYNLGLDSLKQIFGEENQTEAELTSLITGTDTPSKDIMNFVVSRANAKHLSRVIKNSMLDQSAEDIAATNPLKLKWLQVDKNGNFRWPISSSPYLETYLDVLRKLIENKTVKAPVNGLNYPIIPDTFIDLDNPAKDGIIMIPGKELGTHVDITTGKTKSVLRPSVVENGVAKPAQILISLDQMVYEEQEAKLITRIDKVTGEEVTEIVKRAKQVKVSLSTFLNEDGTLNMDKLPKQLLEHIVYRTPNQDYNMTSAVEVVGFLPSGYKSTMVAPKEFIATMGQDFDIDKLFANMFSVIKRLDGSYKMIDEAMSQEFPSLERAFLNNEKLRISMTIFLNKDIINNELSKSLNGEETFQEPMPGDTESFADRLYGIINPNKEATKRVHSLYGSAFNEINRNNASGAKQSIGVFALGSRVHSVYQGAKINWFKDGKKVVPQLGDITSTYVGDPRSSKFIASEDIPGATDLEVQMDRAKNNLSAFLSASVDDEVLRMLHKLGVGEETFGIIVSMIEFGLKAKTASAIATMPMFKTQESMASTTSKLIKAYNKGRAASERINTKTKAGKEIISPKYFSKLYGQEKYNEADLTEYMLVLNEKLHDESIYDLSDIEQLDIIRLIAFVNNTGKAFDHTVSQFRFLINTDSKGVIRDRVKYLKKMAVISNPDNKAVWEQVGKLVNMRNNAKVYEFYNEQSSALLMNNPTALNVLGILADGLVYLPSVYSILEGIRLKTNKRFKPDTKALINRINTIKLSTEDDAVEFRESNEFFKGLSVTENSISFNNGTDIKSVDVYHALEDLADDSEVVGINMTVLKQDLIRYALTSSNKSMATSFINHIDPTHFDELVTIAQKEKGFYVGKDAVEEIDDYEIAAYATFVNPSVAQRSDNKTNTAIWVTESDKKITVHYRMPVEDGYEVNTFTEYDFKAMKNTFSTESMFDVPSSEGIAGLRENGIFARDKDGNIMYSNGLPVSQVEESNVEQLYSILERTLSTRAVTPLKQLIKTILPPNTKFILTENESSWASSMNELTVGKVAARSKDMAGTIIHEITHSVLMEAIRQYINGTLTSKDNPDGNPINQEIHKVLTNLDEGRGNVIEYFTSVIENLTKEGDEAFAPDEGLDAGRMLKAATAVMITPEAFDQAKQVLFPDEPTVADYVVLREIMKEKLYEVRIEGGYTSIVLTTPAEDGSRITLNEGDETFKLLMDSISDNYMQTMDDYIAFKTQTAGIADDVMSDKYFAMMYGTLNMHEFTSQAYKSGTSSSVRNQGRIIGYKQMIVRNSERLGGRDGYTPILPRKIADIFLTAIDKIVDLVRAIIGKKSGNILYNDVLYMKMLVKHPMFVVQSEVGAKTWVPTELTEEILKCK